MESSVATGAAKIATTGTDSVATTASSVFAGTGADVTSSVVRLKRGMSWFGVVASGVS